MLDKRNTLFIWLGGSLLIYVVFAFWFPLIPYVNQSPPYDVRSFSPSLAAGLLVALLLVAIFTFYRAAVQNALGTSAGGISRRWILGGTLLLALPLLFTYPINATDLYRYVIRGRVQSVYNANPFAQPPTTFPEDPFLTLAGEWADETSPYGPLWELAAAGVTAVTGHNLFAGLLAFKLLALLAHLAIAALIWHIHRQETAAFRCRRTLLWAWNPALLLLFVVDGHNDALMLVWIVLGVWAVREEQWLRGILLLVIAALTKPIALLLLPIFFIAGWRALLDKSSRLRFALGTAFGGGLLGLAAFLPFGSPLDLGSRLLREASLNPGFSPATLILLAANRLDLSLSIPVLGNWLRLAGGLLLLWLMWRTWRGRSPLRGGADIFAGYIFQAFSFRLWYVTWPLPLLLLDTTSGAKTEKRLQTGLWVLLNVQLSVIIYGHIWRYLLGGDHFWSHLIGVPFVFVLPFLLTRLGKWHW